LVVTIRFVRRPSDVGLIRTCGVSPPGPLCADAINQRAESPVAMLRIDSFDSSVTSQMNSGTHASEASAGASIG
jgi:hypothetical protein